MLSTIVCQSVENRVLKTLFAVAVQISEAYQHEKNRWSRVSMSMEQKTHVTVEPLFQVSMQSPVDRWFRLVSQA